MKKLRFEIGDKVVPVSKSIGRELEDSFCWRNAQNNDQPFLYVVRKDFLSSDGDQIDYSCNHKATTNFGDRFMESDLIPYEEPKPSHIGESFVDNQSFLTHIVNGPATIVILYGDDGIYKGVAKCAPGDTFDKNKGYEIALCRASIKRTTAKLKRLCK